MARSRWPETLGAIGEVTKFRMTQERHKIKPDMPAIGRVACTLVGFFLIVGSTALFFAVRPLSWGVFWTGIGAVGLGADLLSGGIRGRWPMTAEAWIYMAQ
jgi:hypothetical protein